MSKRAAMTLALASATALLYMLMVFFEVVDPIKTMDGEDDEAPIRVRNNSLYIEGNPGHTWDEHLEGDHDDATPNYTLEPSGVDLDGFKGFEVNVVYKTSSNCSSGTTLLGKRISIEFGDGSTVKFTAHLSRAKRRSAPRFAIRTRVRPHDGFSKVSTEKFDYLEHKGAEAEFISAIYVGTAYCRFSKADDLNYISIARCNKRECQ